MGWTMHIRRKIALLLAEKWLGAKLYKYEFVSKKGNVFSGEILVTDSGMNAMSMAFRSDTNVVAETYLTPVNP